MPWKTVLLVTCLSLTAYAQRSELIWEDNFDFFDPSKWEHEVDATGGGNGEFQVYIPDDENTFTQDGKLYIKPTEIKDNINPKTGRPFGEHWLWNGVLDLWDLYGKCSKKWNNGCYRDKGNIPPIASGRIVSKGRFSFKYGRVEVRAKMPGGDWTWPAIWMMPEDSVYGNWPKSGEIDILEVRGNRNLRWGTDGPMLGQQRMQTALHWGISKKENKAHKTKGKMYDHENTYANGFHTYVLEWSKNGLHFLVDGESVMTVPNPPVNQNPNWRGFWEFGKPWRTNNNIWAGASKMAPFDQEFHFIMNVAVGGTGGFFSDKAMNHDGLYNQPWKNSWRWRRAKDGFYTRKSDWLWTWEDNVNAMEVDYIRVYKI